MKDMRLEKTIIFDDLREKRNNETYALTEQGPTAKTASLEARRKRNRKKRTKNK